MSVASIITNSSSSCSTGGAASAAISEHSGKRTSGVFWQCIGESTLLNGGTVYIYEIRDAYHFSFDPPAIQSKKIAATIDKAKEIFPALELLPEELESVLFFPTTPIEMSAMTWEKMMKHYAQDVEGKKMMAPDKALKKNLRSYLPKELDVEKIFSEMLAVMQVSTIDDDPALPNDLAHLCVKVLDKSLASHKDYNARCAEIFKRNMENKQIIEALGVSLRLCNSKWILTLSDPQTLQRFWNELRVKYPRLPALSIHESDGKAGDLEFLKARARGEIVLSVNKEYLHDFQAHILTMIRVILNNSGSGDVCITEYLQKINRLAGKFVYYIEMSEAYIGDEPDSLLTRDELKAITTLFGSMIDSITANRELDDYIVNSVSIPDIARGQIHVNSWESFFLNEFSGLKIRGSSKNKLENVVAKLTQVINKIDADSADLLKGRPQ